MADPLDVNRVSWDERADVHAASPDYGVDRFVADPSYLSDVVRFDQSGLGDLAGRRGVHLQCHIGTDTLSLARLGARMTGLDFSERAVAQARRLAEQAGPHVDFVVSDLYSAPDVLDHGSYDLVFTGIGALCWLPDIARWGEVVATLLAPGGRLFLREGHPVLASLGDVRDDGLLTIEYPYFEQAEATVWDEPGTYVQTDHVFENTVTHEWNHGVGEVASALLAQGLRIIGLEEHDSVPWDALPGLMELDPATGEYRLRDRPHRLPATYTLQAAKD